MIHERCSMSAYRRISNLIGNGFGLRLFMLNLLALAIHSPAWGQGAAGGEWEKILEAARKEGKVVAAVPSSAELRRDLEKSFGERYKGIQLELFPGLASAHASRIVNEYRAGVRNFDLLLAGTGVQLDLVHQGVVEPFEPYMVLPEVKDPKNWFGGHIWADNVSGKRFVYSFQAYITDPGFYNSESANFEELRSYDEFLNPKWKGKIGIHDPRRPGSGQAIWIYMRGVKGDEFMKRLAAQDLLVSSDYRQLGDLLSKGRLSFVLGATYSVLKPFIEAGLPIKKIPVPREGIHATSGFGAVTIMKNPPHPNAAKVFVNWLLGKEGQEIFGRALGNATRRFDVDTKWMTEIGIQAAKDFMTVEEYLKRESFFEDRIPSRKPAIDLANKLLK